MWGWGAPCGAEAVLQQRWVRHLLQARLCAAALLSVQCASLAPPALPPHPAQGTIAGCCSSCAATSGCNAWRYCSQKGGCRLPEGQTIK